MTGRRVDYAVILDGRSAAMLWQAAHLDDLRIKARGRNDELYSVLVDIYQTSLQWRTSVEGKPPRQVGEAEKTHQWWAPQHIARAIGVHPRTIRNDIHSGRLPAVKEGRIWMVREPDARTYIASRSRA